MNIQQFTYILAVADTRHFENAAELCHISQSTLSTMIIKFEDELGITIFDRKQKPVGITREGEKLINQIKIITHEISQLEEIAWEIKGETKGTLRIGCIPTVAPYLLPLFLPEFSNKYPGLKFEIKEMTTNENIRWLKTRDLDIGIVSTPLHEDFLDEWHLYKEPFMLYDASMASEQKITTEEIDMKNFWVLEDGHCMTDQVLKICEISKRKASIQDNINFKAGSLSSLLNFVNATGGRTLLPYLSINNLDQNKISFFKDPKPFRNIGMVAHQHFAKKKLIKDLQQTIIKSVEPMLKNIIKTTDC